jgi:hypothetical protein
MEVPRQPALAEAPEGWQRQRGGWLYVSGWVRRRQGARRAHCMAHLGFSSGSRSLAGIVPMQGGSGQDLDELAAAGSQRTCELRLLHAAQG